MGELCMDADTFGDMSDSVRQLSDTSHEVSDMPSRVSDTSRVMADTARGEKSGLAGFLRGTRGGKHSERSPRMRGLDRKRAPASTIQALELCLDADTFGGMSDSVRQLSDTSAKVSDTARHLSDTSG
ncbi:hypothetical protein [Sporosarcina trichiuri]|uniref:hypothetical protein n=1 Tax=Sporosarcina trichiuri TaxID=3056445 RepID=UPI0025B5A368|nr:hypothetical protein [Sporosarcina sp. 0.2-SM1T-5]WJY26349.1 hypothetical protein QWT68_09655 [Sporosarcina sp. 0.2-SM1T-5]